MQFIQPHFSKPVNAAPPLSAVPVSFTVNDDDDDDDDGDLPELDTKKKIMIGALILGGFLVSRGKIKPSTAMKVLKYAGGGLFGTGLLGLPQHGGHGPDSAAIPPHQLPPRGAPIPAPFTPRPGQSPIPPAAKAIILGAYGAVIRANIGDHISDGRVMELIALAVRVLSPRGRSGLPTGPGSGGSGGPGAPVGGIIPELEIITDILRKLKVVGGGSGQGGDDDPLAGGFRTIFGGMGDVAQGNPKGIVNNLTRAAQKGVKGPGRELVAQTADP